MPTEDVKTMMSSQPVRLYPLLKTFAQEHAYRRNLDNAINDDFLTLSLDKEKEESKRAPILHVPSCDEESIADFKAKAKRKRNLYWKKRFRRG